MTDSTNQVEALSEFEISTIGELGNIAMGSGATTLSMVLNKPVGITAPEVTSTTLAELAAAYPSPLVLVEVKYTVGLEHANVFMLTPGDTAVICDLMMGGDGTSPSPEIGEMQLSAVGEAMNQMMGTAATAMSQFFGRKVDISPPTINFIQLSGEDQIQRDFADEPLTQITFKLTVEGLIDSQLIQVIPTRSVRKLVEDLVMAADDPEAVAAAVAAEEAARRKAEEEKAAAAAAAAAPPPSAQEATTTVPAADDFGLPGGLPGGLPQSAVAGGMETALPRSAVADMPAHQPYQEAASAAPPGYPPGYGQPQGYPPGYGQPQYPPPGYGQPQYPPPGYGGYAQPGPSPFQADPVAVKQAQFAPLAAPPGMEGISGLDLIMDVPLKVTVELGRTRMQIRDVLDLGKGSVVELDRLVGEPIDMLVNGKLIAKGEVVVIDENFGIRVTDIVSPIERFNNLKLT